MLFVYREEYYIQRREPSPNTEAHAKWTAELEAVQGIAEVIIGKQRHGPTGTARLQFTGAFTRFDSLDRTHHLAPIECLIITIMTFRYLRPMLRFRAVLVFRQDSATAIQTGGILTEA